MIFPITSHYHIYTLFPADVGMNGPVQICSRNFYHITCILSLALRRRVRHTKFARNFHYISRLISFSDSKWMFPRQLNGDKEPLK